MVILMHFCEKSVRGVYSLALQDAYLSPSPQPTSHIYIFRMNIIVLNILHSTDYFSPLLLDLMAVNHSL